MLLLILASQKRGQRCPPVFPRLPPFDRPSPCLGSVSLPSSERCTHLLPGPSPPFSHSVLVCVSPLDTVPGRDADPWGEKPACVQSSLGGVVSSPDFPEAHPVGHWWGIKAKDRHLLT